MRRHLLLISLLALGAASAAAASKTTLLEFDPANTTVQFTLADVLHTVHGTFQLTRGTIEFDPETGKASGAVVVNAASGKSGSDARDSRMHKNILESVRFPEIIFKPDHVVGKVLPDGTSHIQVHGRFTLHGAEHDVTLPFDVKNDQAQMVADSHFAVPYVQWGLKNPSTFFLRVSPTVDIDVHAVAKIGSPR